MAQALPDLRMTVAQFVHWEDGSDTRYELVRGRPVALPLPSGRHAEISCNIFRAFDAQLPSGCRALFGAGIARDLADDECRLPDVFVTEEPIPEHIFTSPRLVAEVLSPATERDERTTKLDFYKSLASIQAIVIVWQDRRRIQLHERDGRRWKVQDFVGGVVPLPGLGVELVVDEIYRGVEFQAAGSLSVGES